MEDRKALPPLVKDSEIDVIFYNDVQTIHKRGHRKQAEYWYRTKLLGSGGGGEVWLQQETERNGTRKEKFRAVKKIAANAEAVKDYIEELNAIAKFSQRKYRDYFVSSFGWYEGPQALYIAMEYCPRGDLQTYLYKRHKLLEGEAQAVMIQVLTGLKLMHEEQFAHRDLKPANILVISHPPDNEWIVKLGDFGLTRRATQIVSTMARGTEAFMPPELRGSHRTKVDHFLVDMWCVGATAYMLLTGKRCFNGDPELLAYIKDNNAFPVDVLAENDASEDSINFIQGTMKVEPSERPNPDQALGWNWLSLSMGSPQLPDDISESPPPSPIPIPEDEQSDAESGEWDTDTPSDDGRSLPDLDLPSESNPQGVSHVRQPALRPASQPEIKSPIDTLTPNLPSAPFLVPTSVSPTPSDQTRVNHDDDSDEAVLSDKNAISASPSHSHFTEQTNQDARKPDHSDPAMDTKINVHAIGEWDQDRLEKPARPAEKMDMYRASWLYSDVFDLVKQAQFAAYFDKHAEYLEPWPSLMDLERYQAGEAVAETLRNFLQGKVGPANGFFERCQLPGCKMPVSIKLAPHCPDCEKRYCHHHRDKQHHDCPNARQISDKTHGNGDTPGNMAHASENTGQSDHQTGAIQHDGALDPSKGLDPRRGEPWAKLVTIELRRWDDPTAKRKRPKFAPIIRQVDSRSGELRIERWGGEGSEDPTVVGFKTKVVSRTHARLVCFQGNWFIQDTGSASGTWLNNLRLSAATQQSDLKPLNEGDLVQLGVDYSGASDEDIYGCVFFRVYFPSQKTSSDDDADIASCSLSDDGTPVTIDTRDHRTRGHGVNKSRNSLLIEYLDTGEPRKDGPLKKPSARVRLTPSKKGKESELTSDMTTMATTEHEPQARGSGERFSSGNVMPQSAISEAPTRLLKSTSNEVSDSHEVSLMDDNSFAADVDQPITRSDLPARELLSSAMSLLARADSGGEERRPVKALQDFEKATAIMHDIFHDHLRNSKHLSTDLSSSYNAIVERIGAQRRYYARVEKKAIEDDTQRARFRQNRASSGQKPEGFEARDRNGNPRYFTPAEWHEMMDLMPDRNDVRLQFAELQIKRPVPQETHSYSPEVMWSMIYDHINSVEDYERRPREEDVKIARMYWEPGNSGSHAVHHDSTPRAPPDGQGHQQEKYEREPSPKPNRHRRTRTDDTLLNSDLKIQDQTKDTSRKRRPKGRSQSPTIIDQKGHPNPGTPAIIPFEHRVTADKLPLLSDGKLFPKPTNDDTISRMFEDLMVRRAWGRTEEKRREMRAYSIDKKWALVYDSLEEEQVRRDKFERRTSSVETLASSGSLWSEVENPMGQSKVERAIQRDRKTVAFRESHSSEEENLPMQRSVDQGHKESRRPVKPLSPEDVLTVQNRLTWRKGVDDREREGGSRGAEPRKGAREKIKEAMRRKR